MNPLTCYLPKYFRPLGHLLAPFCCYTWGAIAGAAISVVGGAVASNQSKKALEGAQGVANNLTYTPVDIDKVRKDAADAATQNATASLALERSLTPDLADTRANLSKSVSDQLKLGGTLPPDIANQVAMAARTAGGTSGGFGGTPGVTAASLGTTALALLNQRQNNAAGLLQTNPLPVAGLDPGQIASLEVANNNAQNQFDASKAGMQTNLINSQGQNSAAQVGQVTSGVAGLAKTYINSLGTPAPSYTSNPAPSTLTFNSTIPSYNASLIPN